MLTTERLAAELGISARQVQRLRSAGLPHLQVGARAVRYDAAVCRRAQLRVMPSESSPS